MSKHSAPHATSLPPSEPFCRTAKLDFLLLPLLCEEESLSHRGRFVARIPYCNTLTKMLRLKMCQSATLDHEAGRWYKRSVPTSWYG